MNRSCEEKFGVSFTRLTGVRKNIQEKSVNLVLIGRFILSFSDEDKSGTENVNITYFQWRSKKWQFSSIN